MLRCLWDMLSVLRVRNSAPELDIYSMYCTQYILRSPKPATQMTEADKGAKLSFVRDVWDSVSGAPSKETRRSDRASQRACIRSKDTIGCLGVMKVRGRS